MGAAHGRLDFQAKHPSTWSMLELGIWTQEIARCIPHVMPG